VIVSVRVLSAGRKGKGRLHIWEAIEYKLLNYNPRFEIESSYIYYWYEKELYSTLYKHEEESRKNKLKKYLCLHSFDVGFLDFFPSGVCCLTRGF
jgi:hypothetical protein